MGLLLDRQIFPISLISYVTVYSCLIYVHNYTLPISTVIRHTFWSAHMMCSAPPVLSWIHNNEIIDQIDLGECQ